VAESRIVVSHREDLWWLLAEAVQLEQMIMCEYLFAEFSLKQGTEEGLTEEQAQAVARWREVIHGIAVEELLHMALVANVMAAIGAAPSFGRPNFPQISGYFPSGIQLALVPFGPEALEHFLYLERPEGMELQDAASFVPGAPPREPLQPDELTPRGQEFATIGHLYRGEGARGDWQDAHYGRFLAMWQEYGELRRADPTFEPARPVLAAFTRQPFDVEAPQPVISDPVTHRVAELGVVAYELILHLLTRFFTHTDETEDQLGTLVGAAIDLMAGALRPLATALTTLPVGEQHPGQTAGFAFEMYYRMGNLVPWRQPAWALLNERLSLLAERCADAAANHGAPEAVFAGGERASAVCQTIAAQVPAELRRRSG
jgi:Ferritin-like